MNTFTTIVAICAGISTILSFISIVKTFGKKKLDANEGLKCLLRSEMLRIYYSNKQNKQLSFYERQNFDYLYDAYKVRHGNSFIDDIYSAIRTWQVVEED